MEDKRFDPVEASRHISRSYSEYLATTIRFGNPRLQEQLEGILSKPGFLSKGPFLEATPPYTKGLSTRQLVERGTLCEGMLRLGGGERELFDPDLVLYEHQVKAIEMARAGKNYIVTTGTGSGKTECFILPILDDILREQETNGPSAGVRAMILYPMNALANDQLKRLRQLLKGTGITEAAEEAVALAKSGVKPIPQHRFAGSVEHAIAHIEEVTVHDLPEEQQRWYAIKLFERDEKVQEKLGLSADTLAHIEKDIAACETELDDDAESIITSQRYDYITSIIDGCLRRAARGELTTSDKIDRVVTNRILALPLFALIMYGVYWIAMGPFGTFITDWTNDVLGGEWLTDGSRALLEGMGVNSVLTGLISDGICAGVGAVLGFVPQMLVLFLLLAILEDCGYMARIAFIMDRIFRRFGLSGKSFIPMLVGTGCGIPGIMASRTIENERDRRMTIMTTTFIPCGAKMPIIGLIAGALFGGSTWIATSAYFIGIAAIIISGVMLKKTKMFAGDPAPFVMELPAYHVPSLGNVLRSTWERGWSFIKKAGTVILLSSVIIWGLSSFGTVNGQFGMVDALYEDESLVTDEYVETVAARMGIAAEEVNPMDGSLLAGVGNFLSPIFKPLGFGSWKPSVATITGLVAKEEVVGTFGVLYNYDDQDGEAELEENGDQIWDRVAADFEAFSDGKGQLAAFSFMIFNLLCAPCFAAMGAIKREMNNGKWTAFAIAYMCIFAWCAALVVYQLGSAFSGALSPVGLIAAIAIIAFVCYMLFFKKYKEADKLLVK